MSSENFANQPWKQNWSGGSFAPMSQEIISHSLYTLRHTYTLPNVISDATLDASCTTESPQTHNQQLQLPPLKNYQRPTQLPVQPIGNPNNNKTTQPMYNTEVPSLPTYFITPVPFLGLQLRLGKNLQPKPPTVTIEEHEE